MRDHFRLALVALVTLLISTVPLQAFTIQIESDGRPIKAWASSEITFDVNPSDCLAAGVSEEQLNASIDQAFHLWNATPATTLKLARGAVVAKTADEINAQAEGGNPLILCDAALSTHLVAAGETPVPIGNIPAVTRVLRINGVRQIALAVVYINADPASASNIARIIRNPQQFEVVLAHEVGHALGLGHSADATALMYYDATAKEALALSEDDVTGITYLYPRQELGGAGIFGCGTTHKPSRPGSSSWIPFGFLLMACWLAVAFAKKLALAQRA